MNTADLLRDTCTQLKSTMQALAFERDRLAEVCCDLDQDIEALEEAIRSLSAPQDGTGGTTTCPYKEVSEREMGVTSVHQSNTWK